jgi:predicted site-specific integrase-resolvase
MLEGRVMQQSVKRGKIKAVRLGSKTIRIDEEEARRLMKQS